MDRRRDPPRLFDLFCGAGGSSLGAKRAGARIVGALDMWRLATDTYGLNFPEALIYQAKAECVSLDDLAKRVGRIDILVASPECTSHSIAKGKRHGRESSRETAFQVVRFAEALKPRWIVVENVIQMMRWNKYRDWYDRVTQLGYHLASGIIDSKHHGIPQTRRRFFVVGDLCREPILPRNGRETTKTVSQILLRNSRCAEDWAFSRLRVQGRAAATVERAARAMAALGMDEPFIMVYYGSDGAGGFQTLDRPLRTVTTIDRFAYVRKNGQGHEMRMLQPPELATAMGFPARYKWAECTRRDRIRLLGNAVCPGVMRAVVKELTREYE